MAATTTAPSPRLPFGLTQDQLRNELYTAWRKDSREPQSAESYKRYRGFADTGFREKEVVIRRQDVGINWKKAVGAGPPKAHGPQQVIDDANDQVPHRGDSFGHKTGAANAATFGDTQVQPCT